MPEAYPSEGKSIIPRPDKTENAEVRPLNYRCPVCGRTVDATKAEQILLHHEHATHPRDFIRPKPVVA